MKAAQRMVILSERGERALFKGCLPIQMARNPAMVARRKARFRGANSGYVLPGQRRAYQCLNVMGVRIWANKPRSFKGMKWRERFATIERFVALCAFRESRAWQRAGELPFSRRRGVYSPIDGVGNVRMALRACRLFINPLDFQEWAELEAAQWSLDAPQMMPAGACVSFAGGFVRGVCWRGEA